MDFSMTPRGKAFHDRVAAFMDEHIVPAEALYEAQLRESPDGRGQPAIMEELKGKARAEGLWNLFLPDERWGAGLTNVEYAPIAELTGRSPIAPEVFNCSAPDTGNMELLALFGTPEQQERWLQPLLDGELRSCFSMTEPAVASSDPRNLQTTIVADGDDYVVNGRKWWSSGIFDSRCELIILVGCSNAEASTYHQQSMVLIPRDTPGVDILRDLPVFGYTDHFGHGEIEYRDVRVPKSYLLGGEGQGFAMAQARLGPGRVHHAMRAVGMAERALRLLCERVTSRTAFGGSLADKGVVQEWIARSRIEIDQVRLLVLHAAWMIDAHGNKAAKANVATIKVAALEMAHRVVERAVQAHGAAAVGPDFPLARMLAVTRALRIADGPDEVHLRTVARNELAAYRRSA